LFGVYVHWPYCAAKCPYCDFNSHVNDSIDHEAWHLAYLREIEYYASLTEARTVTSIFFGGGTPSLMVPETVEAVISCIAGCWTLSDDVEITLEANPTSVEANKFMSFREAGVNRVSLGVQSFNDHDLQFLGRKHSAEDAKRAIDIAANIFDRYSFDLIYARPEQTMVEWEKELKEALKFAKDHMSLYQLTIERGTPFYMQHKRGEFVTPDENLSADLFELTQKIMDDVCMPAYEVSNHASHGQESRHNMTYWRYGDYVGIGPGAHGRLTIDGTKKATRGHRAPDIWLKNVKDKGWGGHPFEDVTPDQKFTEALMMGLRLYEGVPLSRLEKAAGRPLPDVLDIDKVRRLRDEGMLEANDNCIQVTQAGMLRLNSILDYLL